MGRIVTIASQKGGVGKTTTTLNLGYSLSRFGNRVLLVDGDPQGGMTIATNLKKRTSLGLIDLVRGTCTPPEIVMAARDGVLSVAGVGRISPEDVFLLEESSRNGTLDQVLRELADGYDYVLFDAPAGIGGLVTSMLAVSQGVLLVVMARMLSLKTIPSFLGLVHWVRTHRNPALHLDGVILSMFVKESASETMLLDELRSSLPDEVFFKTIIPLDDLYEKASIKAVPVGMLPGGERGAKAYLDLAIEYREREMAQTGEGADNEHVAGLF